MEQRLARDRIAHDDALVARIAARPEGGRRRRARRLVAIVRRRQRLQIVRPHARRFGGEALVQHLLGADHFARVALDAAADVTVAGLDAERIVDGLEGGTLQQLHDGVMCDGFVCFGVFKCRQYIPVPPLKWLWLFHLFERRSFANNSIH